MADRRKKQSAITVIGSLNIDFITRTARLPAAGETLAALSFETGFGGKGANQAVACARLLANHPTAAAATAAEEEEEEEVAVRVRMVGNVGAEDSFGSDYVAALGREGIDASRVRRRAGCRTGVTNIIVERDSGENRILFVANANEEFAAEEELLIEDEDGEGEGGGEEEGGEEIVVFQLEIPLEVVLYNMHQARMSSSSSSSSSSTTSNQKTKTKKQKQRHVILNPAPAVPLPPEAYADIDTLIMNETEAGILLQGGEATERAAEPTTEEEHGRDAQKQGGENAQTTTEKQQQQQQQQQFDGLIAVAKHFLARGVRDAVIITLGARGLVYATAGGGGGEGHVAARQVRVVDTTAAGDTFVGGYAVQRAKQQQQQQQGGGESGEGGFDHVRALEFATRAASRTVEKAGAMAAIPYLRELDT